MKCSIIIVSSLIVGALARPQASATITAAPSVASVALTPAQTCLASCQAGDVTCQAACVGAAHPNSSQVADTTQCAANCDQGNGTPAATEKYSQCVQACIASFFPTSQTVAPAVGSQAASVSGASASGSQASEATGKSATVTATGAKATGSAASGTATAATASSSKGAANVHAQMGAGAASFAGLLMAVFAL